MPDPISAPQEPTSLGATGVPLVDPPQDTPQSQTTPQPDAAQELIRKQQSEMDKLKWKIEQLQYATNQPKAVTQPQVDAFSNPYDPQTQPNEWWVKERELISAQSAKMVREEIEQILKTSQESAWSQNHGGVNIDAVKNYISYHLGVPVGYITPQLLEIGYKAMTGQTEQGSPRPQEQQTIQQTTTPPLRQTMPPNVQGKVLFSDLVTQYNQNPNVINTWSPQMQQDFKRELLARAKEGR